MFLKKNKKGLNMRAKNKTACLLMISIILLLIGSAWGNEKIIIERLGIDILFPNNYKIIPHSQWKSDLAIGQQFIMKNPFEFDYLLQKRVQKEKELRPFETSYFFIKSKHTRRITDEKRGQIFD